MGLAALALEGYPVWPTYPERMLDADVTAGLVLPNAAVAMLGKGGAVATIILAVGFLGIADPTPLLTQDTVYGHHEYLLFGADLSLVYLGV